MLYFLQQLLEFDSFDTGFVAACDGDGCFGDIEMFGKKFDEGSISLAIVRFGAKKNSKITWSGFDNFFLRGAWFYGDVVFHRHII